MRLSKPTLRNSFFGWMGAAAPSPAVEATASLQGIRERMLGELLRGPAPGHPGLTRRIFRAQDAQTLWYCRSELMQVLARARGEAEAAAAVAELTPLFRGLLPEGILSTGGVMRRR
jgi:hypothetical protein